MRLQVCIILILALGACKEHNPDLNRVLIYGHGGTGFDGVNAQYAANSVPSIREALDVYGLDGVELDVRFTRDGDLLVYHDQFLETSTQCKGEISGLKLSDIGDCLYRKQFRNGYQHQVITIDSLISLVNTNYQDRYISLNVHDFEIPFILDSIAGLFHLKLQGFASHEKLTIECSDANFLFFLKARDLNHKCYLISDIDTSGVKDVMRFKLDGIVGKFEKRDKVLERQLSDSNKVVILYGQKLPKNFTKYDYTYIDAVQVDNPILALKYFRNL
ncbi:MAG: hypothetical protein COA58_03415 [Bacteroidetes bacterium]|nr:MAG: hypothetical protein COA58_03415 [Bacteroidota bacterium]